MVMKRGNNDGMVRKAIRGVLLLEAVAIAFFVTCLSMVPFVAMTGVCTAGPPHCPQSSIGDIAMVVVFLLILPETIFLSRSLKRHHPVLFHSIAAICLLWTAAFFVLL